MKKKLLFALVLATLLILGICVFASCECQHEPIISEDVSPTCTGWGWKHTNCKKCGEKLDFENYEPTGHKYIEVSKEEATCGKNGKINYVCSVCEDTRYDTIPQLEEHQFVEATCTSPAKCTVCGETNGYSLGHSYSESNGTCTRCDYGVKFILPSPPQEIITYDYRGNIEAKCKIVDIKIERVVSYATTKYVITFTVESTYHKNGSSYSDYSNFNWKLYDSEGMVFDSGTERTDASIEVGERSKASFEIYVGEDNNKLKDGETYTLTLLHIG